MFDSFMSWIATKITSGLSLLVTGMLQCLNMDISVFVQYFPVAATMYTILQSVAVGLVFAFAVWNLMKFATGNIANLTESPVQILIMTAVSTFMVFFGNNILQAVINVFSYPYADLMAVSAVSQTGNPFDFTSIGSNLDLALAGLAGAGLGSSVGAGIALVYVVIMLILGYQVLALVFEMVERWIMLGVIVYTAPLAWGTLVSANSRPIFQKWLNMFISQCLLLLINAWSVKMLFSIMSVPEGVSFGPMVVVLSLCFCKVARQLDTYLKQIGLNPAGTGRSLMDDIRGTAQTLIRGSLIRGRNASGSSSNVLGSRAHQNSAVAVAERIAAHNNKGIVGRAVDNLAHPVQRASDNVRHIANGVMGKNQISADGRPVAGVRGATESAKDIFGLKKTDGVSTIGAGMDGSYGRNAADAKVRINDGLPKMRVGRSGSGEKAVLTGDRINQADAVAYYGNDAFYDKEWNRAMQNSAAAFDAEQLETAIDHSNMIANSDVTNAMVQNLATQAGAEEFMEQSNFEAVQKAAANADTEAERTSILMSQFGSAQENLTLQEARENFTRLNEQFGEAAGGEHYEMLFGKPPEAEQYQVQELTAAGREKTLETARQEHAALLQEAHTYEQNEQQMRDLAETNQESGQDSAPALQRAAEYHNLAAVTHEKADHFAETYFGDQDPAMATSLREDAPALGNIEWSDISPEVKEAQLQEVKDVYEHYLDTGRYQDAADYAISTTGTLDPRNLTAAELEHADPSSGMRTIENMAMHPNNTTATWTEAKANYGDLTATMQAPVYQDGRYVPAKSQVSFRTSSGYDSLREDQRAQYRSTHVGNVTYYTNFNHQYSQRAASNPGAASAEPSRREQTVHAAKAAGSAVRTAAVGVVKEQAAPFGTDTRRDISRTLNHARGEKRIETAKRKSAGGKPTRGKKK